MKHGHQRLKVMQSIHQREYYSAHLRRFLDTWRFLTFSPSQREERKMPVMCSKHRGPQGLFDAITRSSSDCRVSKYVWICTNLKSTTDKTNVCDEKHVPCSYDPIGSYGCNELIKSSEHAKNDYRFVLESRVVHFTVFGVFVGQSKTFGPGSSCLVLWEERRE